MADEKEDTKEDTPEETKADETPEAKAEAKEAKKADDGGAAKEKAKLKAQIHALKEKRNAAIEAHDAKQLKWTRLNIKRLKQRIRQVSA